MTNKMILSMSADAKTIKGEKLGYLTGILYLAPADLSGVNLCPNAKNAGCIDACLYSAGRGAFNNVQQARMNKTELFNNNLPAFMEKLIWSIKKVERKAEKEGLKPCIRLNGTSDINWQAITTKNGLTIFEEFPHIQFYDYTKIPKESKFSNYHITFSYSSVNSYKKTVMKALQKGMNIAVVFKDEFPKTFLNKKVINGDNSDLRFLDECGKIIGLKAKGKAKKDESGFVIDSNFIPTF